MKKYFLIVFCTVLLFVVTGCGSKSQVTCTKTGEEEGIKMKMDVIAEFDSSEKITGATLVYDIDNKTMADAFCKAMQATADESKGRTVSCSGTKITIKGIDSFDENEEDSEKIVGSSKTAFVTEAANAGFTCK